MKILYIKNGWYDDHESLENATQINGVDVLFVDGVRDIFDTSLTERKDTEHFLTYDHDDYHLGTRGITCRTDYDDYLFLENKLLDRIDENETIILVTDRPWRSDDVDFMIYLMEKKPFYLHIIKQICPSYQSNDYHEYLRVFDNLNKINSIGYIIGNKYPTTDDDSDEVWGEKQELNRQYHFNKICEIISSIQNLDPNKFYIYNHEQKQYLETQRPNYSGDSMYEFVTPSENENMCEILYSYRKAFAERYGIDYDAKTCSECECYGICRSVCRECDLKSSLMWEKIYVDSFIDFDTGEDNTPYKYNRNIEANINGVDRLRINTDGNGIRSLILMAGCPLNCKYCGNKKYKDIFPETGQVCLDGLDDLNSILEKDGIYFEMTNGGVTFGGGEPLLQADFIHEFHKKYPMWDIVIETCLNVEFANIKKIAGDIGCWYIDIKDMNPEIYQKYTGATNDSVVHNLEKMSSIVSIEKICIRVPRIPGYNTEQDITNSVAKLQALGYTNIEIFDYIV